MRTLTMNLMINIASEVDQNGRPRADASGRVFAVMASFEASGKGFEASEPIAPAKPICNKPMLRCQFADVIEDVRLLTPESIRRKIEL